MNMAAPSPEVPEPQVVIGDESVSIEELSNLRDAVCLLRCHSVHTSMKWSGHGFYADVKLNQQAETLDMHCIITSYDDIFAETQLFANEMVAIFHHESTEKETFELPLVPFRLLAHSNTEELNYALIAIDKNEVQVKGVKPILADRSQLPVVQPYDRVYMIHHSRKTKKIYSHDIAKDVIKPYIEYLANTLEGPPGYPVFMFENSRFLLVALHSNKPREKGVLVSEILDDFTSGKEPVAMAASFSYHHRRSMMKAHSASLEPGEEEPAAQVAWIKQRQGELEVEFALIREHQKKLEEVSRSSSDQEQLSWIKGKQLFLEEELAWIKRSQAQLEGQLVWLKRPQGGLGERFELRGYAHDEFLLGDLFLSESMPVPLRAGGSFVEDPTSVNPTVTEKLITTEGGVLNIGNFTLKIGPGCLAENRLITLTDNIEESGFKTLLDVGLVSTVPQVVKFLPGGLTFMKPADVAILFQKRTVPDSEHFILHGSYNPKYEKTVWELVTNGIQENNLKGVINIKINHFSFLTYIISRRGKLARILGHLNGFFSCRAYCFYRRNPSIDTIDISVVLLSEFVDENKEEDIKQLNDHFEAGYVKAEKGLLKLVHTNRRLELCLDFPEVEYTPFLFRIRQSQLDSVGFAVDHFKGIKVNSPAYGAVTVSEIKHGEEKKSLWKLNVCEIEDKITVEEQFVAPDVLPEAIHRTTKLTNEEINWISPKLGIDWDNLAALMDICYSEREEIRVNYVKYPSLPSKAKRVFELFNGTENFDRHVLAKYFEELGRHDMKNEMLPIEDEGESGEEVGTPATPTSQLDVAKVQLQNGTPLSSREMHMLSRHLVVNWDKLAALLDITPAERDDIRHSLLYTTSHSRAEKMLATFNKLKDFSRQKLAECLEEIGQLELKEPIITGEWKT